MLTIKYFRVWVFGYSCHVGAYGAANHRAAHWALLEAAVAALADGEVAALDEHHRVRGRYTHDAHALLRGNCLLCVRGRDYYGLAASRTTAAGGHEIVRGVPPELCSARHEVASLSMWFSLFHSSYAQRHSSSCCAYGKSFPAKLTNWLELHQISVWHHTVKHIDHTFKVLTLAYF